MSDSGLDIRERVRMVWVKAVSTYDVENPQWIDRLVNEVVEICEDEFYYRKRLKYGG